jgi:hypothetical protein
MTKSSNKFDSRTCRKNLTTAYGNSNQTCRKIFARKIIRGPDTQFATIFIREYFCVYGMQKTDKPVALSINVHQSAHHTQAYLLTYLQPDHCPLN